jgi:hypothetical protein
LNKTDDVTDVIAVLQQLVGRRGNRANQAQGQPALNGVSWGSRSHTGSEAHHFADDPRSSKSGI